MKDLGVIITTYLPLLFTVMVSLLLSFKYRKKVVKQQLARKLAKRSYSIIVFLTGLFSSFALFPGLFTVLHMNFGHGEMIIFLILANILLSLVLIVIGRIVIAWETMIY